MGGNVDIWSLWVEDEQDRRYFWSQLGRYIPDNARFEHLERQAEEEEEEEESGGEFSSFLSFFSASVQRERNAPSKAINRKIQFPDLNRLRDSYERNRVRSESKFRRDMEQKLENPQFVSAVMAMLSNASI